MPDDPEFLVPIGKARIARAGEHVTITAFSRMVKLALQAAEELEKAGISAEVIDLRSLRPFDVAAVAESVKKTNRIVSVEEGWPFAGIGSEIAAIVMEECFDWLDAPLAYRQDVPLPYAANLERRGAAGRGHRRRGGDRRNQPAAPQVEIDSRKARGSRTGIRQCRSKSGCRPCRRR